MAGVAPPYDAHPLRSAAMLFRLHSVPLARCVPSPRPRPSTLDVTPIRRLLTIAPTYRISICIVSSISPRHPSSHLPEASLRGSLLVYSARTTRARHGQQRSRRSSHIRWYACTALPRGISERPTDTSRFLFSASGLRIGILHSRWNAPIISALLDGTRGALLAAGVLPHNIVVQSVPGSYELPYAAQRMYAASQTSSSASSLVSAATDLLMSSGGEAAATGDAAQAAGQQGPLDAIVAIGVLIKGSTMHFEYICDSVSHGLMRVQLDTGCPVIFGVLTCLTEDQAYTRAGMKGQSASAGTGVAEADLAGKKSYQVSDGEGGGLEDAALTYGERGHNHGEDWGKAAVEMSVKRREWSEGRFID